LSSSKMLAPRTLLVLMSVTGLGLLMAVSVDSGSIQQETSKPNSNEDVIVEDTEGENVSNLAG